MSSLEIMTIPGLGDEGFRHGFSTAAWGSMKRSGDGAALTPARAAFITHLGLDPAWATAMVGVHGTDITRVDEPRGIVIGVDGLVTDQPGIALMAPFADCRPLLLYDPLRRSAGIFHAGWRGCASGMAAAGVAALVREYGSRPQDLWAGIGPGICGSCYEVGPEVAAAFGPEFARSRPGGRALLDLASVCRTQLLEAGVPSERVLLHPACTSETKALFSHRRCPDGSRFAAVAALPT
jgi:polyphenol oxidase